MQKKRQEGLRVEGLVESTKAPNHKLFETYLLWGCYLRAASVSVRLWAPNDLFLSPSDSFP